MMTEQEYKGFQQQQEVEMIRTLSEDLYEMGLITEDDFNQIYLLSDKRYLAQALEHLIKLI